jgi:ankyrin repeat protein
MTAYDENIDQNLLGSESPTSSETFSPVKAFIDPMAMLLAAKNEGNCEIDERTARALEQKLEKQRREEIEQQRVALQLQSEEDEALLRAAQQEEDDMIAATRAQKEEEQKAREDLEEKQRLEKIDAELARKLADDLDHSEKEQEAKDAELAATITRDVAVEFHTAIKKKNVLHIAEMLKGGCDAGLTVRHGETSSPLQVAVDANLPNVVKMLIEAKAPLDYRDGKGDTALHWAAALKRIECMQELIAAGATLDIENTQGFTPIISAAKAGYSEPIRLLVEKGANLYHKDKDFKMALHHVPFLCRSLKLLLQRMCGWGLLEAAAKGRGNDVTDLIRRGASPRLSDENLLTPLHHAAANGHNIIVEYLLAQKSKINAVDKTGQTALHKSAQHCHELVVYTLLRHGADATITDNNGKRAIDLVNRAHKAYSVLQSLPSPIKNASTHSSPSPPPPLPADTTPPQPPPTRPSPIKGCADGC